MDSIEIVLANLKNDEDLKKEIIERINSNRKLLNLELKNMGKSDTPMPYDEYTDIHIKRIKYINDYDINEQLYTPISVSVTQKGQDVFRDYLKIIDDTLNTSQIDYNYLFAQNLFKLLKQHITIQV